MAGFAGNSGGALAAAAIAVEHPELVQTLIILDSNTLAPGTPPLQETSIQSLKRGRWDL